jgi:hypothetical protein
LFGVITFSPINYQKMHDAPTNYQIDQNRAFNYHSYMFRPLPSVKVVKIDNQPIMCASRAFLMNFLPLLPSSPSFLSYSISLSLSLSLSSLQHLYPSLIFL